MMFFTLSLLIPLALALPQASAPAPTPIPSPVPISQPAPSPSSSPIPDPAMTVSVQTFHAYVFPSGSPYANYTNFLVSSTGTPSPENQNQTDPVSGFLCSYTTNGPLYNANDWHDCEQRRGSGMDMSFRIDEGFERLWVKKGWFDQNGMYMIGIASQPTYWNHGDGGNVTATGLGMYYERIAQWYFFIDSISA